VVYSHPNNLVTQNTSLEETKALFESKSNEATKKYHVKIYREFAKLCHILIKRPLTEDQKSTIDEELKSYRLKALEENTYSKHKKKLNRFKKFLRERYGWVTSGYYTTLFMILGMVLGQSIGLSIHPSTGLAIGLGAGMSVGMALGAWRDQALKKENKVLEYAEK